jgi:hypothetical protein
VRCRKARWFLSARCDGTLSERQRVRLDEHLKQCAECRREAFYFSEIGSLIPRVEKVPVRPDFNLRLRAAIQREEAKVAAPRRWYMREFSPVARLALGSAMVMVLFVASYGSYQMLNLSADVPVTVVPAPQTAAHTDYAGRPLDVSSRSDEWNSYPSGWTELNLTTPEGLAASERYLSVRRNPGEFVLETYRLADPTAKKPGPTYMMTTVSSEQVIQRDSY